jgi:hypothetical protein
VPSSSASNYPKCSILGGYGSAVWVLIVGWQSDIVVGESVGLVVMCHGRGLGIVAGMFVADWWSGVEVHLCYTVVIGRWVGSWEVVLNYLWHEMVLMGIQ